MEIVAQLVERKIVALVVMGSNPINLLCTSVLRERDFI